MTEELLELDADEMEAVAGGHGGTIDPNGAP